MGAFFLVVLMLWVWTAVLSSPYFWFKKTDRSQAPIVRRGMAILYGFAWPYLVITYFPRKADREREERDRRAAERRILGDAPAGPVPSGPAGRPTPPARPSGIQNPFDA
jgi:hypothetical protein